MNLFWYKLLGRAGARQNLVQNETGKIMDERIISEKIRLVIRTPIILFCSPPGGYEFKYFISLLL